MAQGTKTLRESFNSQVKAELAHLRPDSACCRRAEVAALLRAVGSLSLSGGQIGLTVVTEQAAVARKLVAAIKHGFGLTVEVAARRQARLKKHLVYQMRIPPQPGLPAMLQAVGVLDNAGHYLEPDPTGLHKECCRRAYLRGAFLGEGWVSDPGGAGGHHLELLTKTPDAADLLSQLLFAQGLRVRMSMRRDRVVLYLKEAEQVSRFLALVGASQAVLAYEDARALRDMKNRVNRQVNAETANLNKTVEASARQLEAIRYLRATGGLERLSPALRELAELREKYPEANLKELGDLCQPPVGKSGINHRMRQLMRMAHLP
jgi:DNA-binding protein WhiA